MKSIYSYVPPRFRYGKSFWETYNFLQESQWWTREKLKEYQIEELKKLLQYTYENVPYYRQVFNERGLKPKNIQDFEDLNSLPYLNKNTFKSRFKDMVSTKIDVRKIPMSHTSGTCGKPLQFYEKLSTWQKERAFIYHSWSMVGYKPGEPRVELRGRIDRENPIYYDPYFKVLRLSPIIDNKEIVRYYLAKMKSFGARFLHGYPGAIASFALAIKRFGLIVPFKLTAILFASEAIYEWERTICQEVFDCRIFSHYGVAEKVALASECEHSHYYHFVPQHGIIEIDPNTHEIIGTGFLNYVNPFIRYRTTDIASKPNFEKCTHCGREYFPVIENVEGRIEDFIVTPKGTLITPAAITHPFKDIKTIKDTQVVQESLDNIILKVVPWKEGDPAMFRVELNQLSHDLKKIIGSEIKTEIVEEIKQLKSGKFKWIKSNISRNYLDEGLMRSNRGSLHTT